MNESPQAELFCNHPGALMLLGVQAHGSVEGRLLSMQLHQKFRNTTDSNAEITYRFPMPWGAVFMGVDIVLNGKPLQGDVIAIDTARAKYENAISNGDTGIILERNEDRSFTLELGNLMAHEDCSITVRYAQVLQLEHGQLRLMLPTTIAPKYGNPLTDGGLLPHQTTETDIGAEYPFDITIALHGDLAKASASCLSHKVTYVPGPDKLQIRLAQAGAMDRDFILVIGELQNQSVALVSADTYKESQLAAMASFSPEIIGGLVNPLAIKILVDCSGSMAGDSITSAKIALHRIALGMGDDDKFSLSKFGEDAEHRSAGMWRGTKQAKRSAQRWIDSLNADMGGTEMASALASTALIAHTGRADILLITDGEINVVYNVISVCQKTNHRVFVVGIGASPSEALVRQLAESTGGACDFVAPGENVEPAVMRMFSRLRSPRVNNLRIEWPSSFAVHWCDELPSRLFVSDALTVFAFGTASNHSGETQQVKLWGQPEGFESEILIASTAISLVGSDIDNTLARMAAANKYLACMLEPSAQTRTNLQAQEIAVDYRLVTNHTAFVLHYERSESEKSYEMPTGFKVPQMLAAGWAGSGSVKQHLGIQPTGIRKAPAKAVYRTTVDAYSAPNSAADKDDYEIPAFLRVQADGPGESIRPVDKENPKRWILADELEIGGYCGITPEGLTTWLRVNHKKNWPTTYADLQEIGLGVAICEWLEYEVGNSADESVVVRAFITVFLKLNLTTVETILNKPPMFAALRSLVEPTPDRMMNQIHDVLVLAEPGCWPAKLVNYPEFN